MCTQPFYINPYHEQFMEVKLNVLKRTRYKVVPGAQEHVLVVLGFISICLIIVQYFICDVFGRRTGQVHFPPTNLEK
jgi:hypothetical protein